MKEKQVDRCVNHWNKVSSNMLKPVFFKEFYDEVEKIKDDTNMNFRADILMKVADNSLRQNLTDRHKQIMCNLFEWTLNKVVYSFDKDVEESFLDLHWSDISTHSISTFNNLPLNAFAISFNNPYKDDEDYFDTVVVFRDFMLNDPSLSSRLYFTFSDTNMIDERHAKFFPMGITTDFHGVYFGDTIEDCYKFNCDNFEMYGSKYRGKLKKLLVHVLPYIFYLCSQNAEICQPLENKKIYRPATNPEYVKHKYREVKQFMCGEQTGCRIRNFKKQQSERRSARKGSMKSPHVRRAHYHRYWKGTGSNRHVEIKWIPPIYVHEDLKGYIKPSKVSVKETY